MCYYTQGYAFQRKSRPLSSVEGLSHYHFLDNNDETQRAALCVTAFKIHLINLRAPRVYLHYKHFRNLDQCRWGHSFAGSVAGEPVQILEVFIGG